MLDKPTNSQIAEQYMHSTYPCLQVWIDFLNAIAEYLSDYDPTSCTQIAMISQAAMKTFDYIAMNNKSAGIIRVSRMLNDLHDSAWTTWVSFKAQSAVSTGTRSLGLTSVVLQGISTFNRWDNALNRSPSFSPPVLFNNILGGITI